MIDLCSIKKSRHRDCILITTKVNIRYITLVLSVILFTQRNSRNKSFVCLRLRRNLCEETCTALDNYSCGIKKKTITCYFTVLSDWLFPSYASSKGRELIYFDKGALLGFSNNHETSFKLSNISKPSLLPQKIKRAAKQPWASTYT